MRNADPTLPRRRLPISVQSFRTLRDEDCYYVDKTALIYQLVNQGWHYFLSRPRRFGKSLLIDTLQELFEGTEPLFRGLYIHPHWNWSEHYPVIRLSLGGNYSQPDYLEKNLVKQLEVIEHRAGLPPGDSSDEAADRLFDLIDRLSDQTGRQVVVLVDEYDKPILDVLDHPEKANANREYLRGFYGIIKDSAKHVRFVFVTGISMFSKINLFSGLNNLKDISLDPRYATICGYTDRDIDTVFAPELPGLDREEIRRWYNGYHWLGNETLYNPYDVLLLFDNREFEPHWYRTSTPTFLYQTLVREDINPRDLVDRHVSKNLITTFDVEGAHLDALLFQSGYLTIAGVEPSGSRTRYRLTYPNHEVAISLNEGLLAHVMKDKHLDTDAKGEELLALLAKHDFDNFVGKLHSYLAAIPHPWHEKGNLGAYEAWYASLLYMTFKVLDAHVQVEDASSHGRSDLVLRHAGQVFVMEFKVVDEAGKVDQALQAALDQIEARRYGGKYRGQGVPIHQVALCFGGPERNIVEVRATLG